MISAERISNRFLEWLDRRPAIGGADDYRVFRVEAKAKLVELVNNSLEEESSRYTFFWRGPLSQWAYSPFCAADEPGYIHFTCAEQYMMHHKATLFGDVDAAEETLKTEKPRDMQAIGRRIKGFVQRVWDDNCEAIVLAGSVLKYTQHRKSREALIATGSTLLVEASPIDRIWGIGMDESTARVVPVERWPGKNLLGKTLTRVRDEIILKEK